MEDSLEQFEESNENGDNKVTWKEYLSRNHGFNINDFKDYTEQDAVNEFTKVSQLSGSCLCHIHFQNHLNSTCSRIRAKHRCHR